MVQIVSSTCDLYHFYKIETETFGEKFISFKTVEN